MQDANSELVPSRKKKLSCTAEKAELKKSNISGAKLPVKEPCKAKHAQE